MNSLIFPKRNGSHADVLAALGAADLLQELSPVITDRRSQFEVELDRAVVDSDFENVGPGFKYLRAKPSPDDGEEETGAKKAAKKVPHSIPSSYVFDYTAENDKYKRQRAAKNSKDPAVRETAQQDSPDPEFRAYRIAKALQADSGLNKFVEQFFALDQARRKSEILKSLKGDGAFFFKTPLVQLFNPQAAKGYGLLKPTGTDRNDKTKEKWAEPFFEWLRYRGFFAGCAGWFLGSKGEHIRVYCPIPGRIPFKVFSQVIAKFRAEALAGSAAKLDCLGVLRLARILIERSHEFVGPSRFISGVWVTHYQSLGRVPAVTAMDRLAVPNWFDLKSETDAKLWLDTLDEHDKVLRRLSDDVSEELGLLRRYRSFLQRQEGEALPALVEFFAAYGHHVFRLRAQGKWLLPQFSRERVEAILQSIYKEILEDTGFRAVADALRSATVSAQVAKKKGGDYRDIQYGVLPELRRKIAAGRDDFTQAVADFVSNFNAESARRYEQGKSGYRISQDDFMRFVQLLERSNWETVGALLCAMATCKLGREEKEDVSE
jgi:hypothetical protein